MEVVASRGRCRFRSFPRAGRSPEMLSVRRVTPNYPKYAGSFPTFHLMLQPTLGFWSAITG